MKRKTRTGNRLGERILPAAAAFGLLLAAGEGCIFGAAKEKTPPSYALVAGTVFRETGMSFPGAEVTVAAAADARAGHKFKKIRVTTSLRGEFAVRLPAAPMTYVVAVKAPGYQPQEKPVAISGDERVDVFFRLEPASK